MKDSGIEWIGEIPEEWKTIKFNALYDLRNQKVSDRDFPPLSVTKNGIVPQLSSAAKTNDGDNRKLVKVGDFAINSRSDRRGSCGISKYEGSVSLINTVLRPINNEMNPDYYNLLFHTFEFADEFYKWGHGIVDDLWTTNWQDMKNITLVYPSKKEQDRIASVLNKKVKQINQTSKTIQQEIDALEEYRKSLITETVTKGLDKTVSMKDSGIEWIGEIPENWKVEPVYLHFKERKNKNAKGKEKNLLSLSYGNIIEKDITQLGGLLPSSYTIYNVVEPGDIIIRPTDLQNDKKSFRTGLVTEHGIITSAYIDLMPCNKQSSKFFHYLLHSYDIQKVFYNMGNGVRQGLNFAEFSKLRLLVPGKEEQSKIARFLDQKCFRIAKVITQKQRQLDYFNKYKQSIIYEYVTGKKQVPEKEGIKNAQ